MKPSITMQSSPLFPVLRPVAACVVALGALTAPVYAQSSFAIKDIRVEGLQRTDPGTVFAALPFRVGDTYSEDKGSAALRALFATGLFTNVRLAVEGEVLVVIVDERPVIALVSFVGLREFDRDTLSKSLKDSGIGEGLPSDKALIDRAEQEIKRQYLSRSFYAAEVVTTVTPVERNRVNVSFAIVEGEPAKIREIRITGNKAFSEGTLRGLLEQSTSGWLTWYTKNDRYSRTKLNGDLEKIRAYYTNRGYVEFNVEAATVTISTDKQSIDVAIAIDEGQRFTVTGVKLEGDYLGKDDDFKKLVKVKPGQPYRSEDVAATVRAFSDHYGLFGYAFARVEQRTEIDRANGQVVVVLNAEPHRRAYVRRINVSGNTRTRDEVVRREFRQFESAWYDGLKIKQSRDRVDRLGFFKDVVVETNEVAGTNDQVDLTLAVTEKPTGNLLFGIGYSSAGGVAFNGSVKQENVFGSGNYLGVEINTNKVSRNFSLATIDPYFTVDGISRAYELFYRTTKPLNTQGETYQLVTPGASLRFGVPFSERDTVFFGIGAERTEIKGQGALPNSFFLYREAFGATSNSIPFTIGWARDERDSVLVPTRGRYMRVNIDLALLGEARYTRTNLQYQQYFALSPRLTLGLNGEFGLGKGLGTRNYPIFKNFYGGGLGSVRVFDQGSLGPVDVTGSYIGGTRKLNLNAELYLPVPGSGNDKTLRIFGFADAGNVWGEFEKMDMASIRVSAGLGLSWISPVGPLKLSWGAPVKKQPSDRIQRFQFQIGTAF